MTFSAVSSVASRFRNLKRATAGPRRRDRRKIPKYEPRDGPKLVRGRGWKRRRNEASLIRFAFYLAFAGIVFGLLATSALAILR